MENTQLQTIEINPDSILVISKHNARAFHSQVKDRIKETGNGLFEYLEFLKFCEKLQKVISGDSQAKNQDDKDGDKELKQMVRDDLAVWGKGGFISKRGVRFELAETGSKYDYSKCGDLTLEGLEEAVEIAKANLKERQDFLQNLPSAGFDSVDLETGAIIKLYPPSKSSNSSYKITLPK